MTIVAEIVAAMRAEFKRQFENGELDWYTEGEDYVAIDGNPNLEKLADVVLTTTRKRLVQP